MSHIRHCYKTRGLGSYFSEILFEKTQALQARILYETLLSCSWFEMAYVVKAFLVREDGKLTEEIRRFTVDLTALVSYQDLYQKVAEKFQCLNDKKFLLQWKGKHILRNSSYYTATG